MHPHDRLRRTYPGERLEQDRPIAERVFTRDQPLREVRSILPEQREQRVRSTRRPKRLADPAPNAPLLKRVVKNPYAEEVRRPVRVDSGRSAREAREQLEGRAPPMREGTEARGDRPVGGPLKHLDLRPGRAALPTVDDWLGGRR